MKPLITRMLALFTFLILIMIVTHGFTDHFIDITQNSTTMENQMKSASFSSSMNSTLFETEHFIIHYRHNGITIAKELGEVAEELYVPSITFMNHTLKNKTKILLDVTKKSPYNLYQWKIFTSLGGYVLPNGTIVLFIQPLWTMESLGSTFKKSIQDIFAHEFNHVLFYDIIGRENYEYFKPYWFGEGLACYFDYNYVKMPYGWHRIGDRSPSIIKKALDNKSFRSFRELVTTEPLDSGERTLYIMESYAAVKFMVEVYGHSNFLHFLDGLENWSKYQSTYANFENAISRGFGKSVIEFDEEWDTWLKDNFTFGVEVKEYKEIDVGGIRLTNDSMYQVPSSWSNEGRILYIDEVNDNLDIYVMDEDGLNVTRLTANEESDMDAKFSPDGSKIVFTSLRDGFFNIYLMNSDGSNVTKLTDDEYIDVGPTWSPDTNRIAFVSDRNGKYDIFSIDVNGTDLQPLVSSPYSDGAPSFSPDGKKLVFSSNRTGNLDLFIMDLENGSIEQLTDTVEYEIFPAWSPDGKKIAFQEFGDYIRVMIIDVDSEDCKSLLRVEQKDSVIAQFYPVWSPDGKKIAVALTNSEAEAVGDVYGDIYILDVETQKEFVPFSTMLILILGIFVIASAIIVVLIFKKRRRVLK